MTFNRVLKHRGTTPFTCPFAISKISVLLPPLVVMYMTAILYLYHSTHNKLILKSCMLLYFIGDRKYSDG